MDNNNKNLKDTGAVGNGGTQDNTGAVGNGGAQEDRGAYGTPSETYNVDTGAYGMPSETYGADSNLSGAQDADSGEYGEQSETRGAHAEAHKRGMWRTPFALDPEEVAEAEAAYARQAAETNKASGKQDYSGYWTSGVSAPAAAPTEIAAKYGERKGFLKELLLSAALAAGTGVAAWLMTSNDGSRSTVYTVAMLCCAVGLVGTGVYSFRAFKARQLVESGAVTTVSGLAKRLRFKRTSDAVTILAGLIKSGKLIGYAVTGGERIVRVAEGSLKKTAAAQPEDGAIRESGLPSEDGAIRESAVQPESNTQPEDDA
ncbi:MAG: hypothetical protein LBT55_08120 [Clostridiaceae bacterium]|jgi:hypothetical protein|nr:hypothetical protein [Clostridiaceae bacterium]